MSHEIVRHRLAAFCQESTRYCNYGKEGFGGEITVIRPSTFAKTDSTYHIWKRSCEHAEVAYFDLLNEGCTPQEARSVLPNSLKTEVVMTADLREWRHFCRMRCPAAAHPAYRGEPLRDSGSPRYAGRCQYAPDPAETDLSRLFRGYYGTVKGENLMKLKSIDGKVPYIMTAGKDFVSDEMSLAAAEQICSRGTQTASKLFPGFPICVDDKFYFAGTSTKPKSSKAKAPCED